MLNALVVAAVDLLHVDGAGWWSPDPDEPGNALPLVTRNISADYVEEGASSTTIRQFAISGGATRRW